MEKCMVEFLGTSHIARQSLDEVKRSIEGEKPDIIALELDERRLHALIHKPKVKLQLSAIRKIGLKGFLFYLFGAWAENVLGKLVGVSPGAEMRQAISLAKKYKIRVAVVDQDIEVTLKRLSDSITWKEKLNFAADLIKGIFGKGAEIEFDLSKVPERKVIDKMMNQLKERYPNFYKVLIEERNIAIANNIVRLKELNPDKSILVILGAGHVDEVSELVKKVEEKHINIHYSFGRENG